MKENYESPSKKSLHPKFFHGTPNHPGVLFIQLHYSWEGLKNTIFRVLARFIKLFQDKPWNLITYNCFVKKRDGTPQTQTKHHVFRCISSQNFKRLKKWNI